MSAERKHRTQREIDMASFRADMDNYFMDDPSGLKQVIASFASRYPTDATHEQITENFFLQHPELKESVDQARQEFGKKFGFNVLSGGSVSTVATRDFIEQIINQKDFRSISRDTPAFAFGGVIMTLPDGTKMPIEEWTRLNVPRDVDE